MWKKNLDLRDPKHSLFPALNWNTDEFSCAMGFANLKRLNQTNQDTSTISAISQTTADGDS